MAKSKKVLSKGEMKAVLKVLEELYPQAESELVYNSPFELLISTQDVRTIVVNCSNCLQI